MCERPHKSEIDFRVSCVKCGQPINIAFDVDGDVEGNVIQLGMTWSGIFQTWCTPLGLHPQEEGYGFKHAFCVANLG